MRYYKKVVTFLENETSYEGEKADQRNALLLAVYLNSAMVHLKQDDDLAACQQCDKALGLDASNEKGLFRRATVRLTTLSKITCIIYKVYRAKECFIFIIIIIIKYSIFIATYSQSAL